MQITDSGAMGEAVYTYNTPKAPDTVERGDFRLVKEIPIEVEDASGIVQESDRVLLPGVQFQLINASENAVVSPETGEKAELGEVVCTIVTDEAGRATSGELCLGTYTVYEAKAKEGYALDVDEKTVTLSYQGQDVAVFDEELEVEDVPTELKVKKVDALDPDKPVAGATFRLWNDEGQTVAVVDIATTAVSPETGDATGVAADGLGLLDTVEYTGLAPGAASTMTGHIADAETGELLMDADGNAYVQEVAFTPEASEGASLSLPALFDGVPGDPGGAEGRAIDWAAFPEAVVAWVEVPGSSID